jgi:hypothetical protein
MSLTGLGISHVAPRWLWLPLLIMGTTLSIGALVFFVWELWNPKLEIKKPLPEPETILHLS